MLKPVLQRPKLARWLWERDYSSDEAADLFSCSRQALRLYCLPFDDSRRQVPGRAIMARIVEVTGAEITAADFYPPHLNGQPGEGDPEVLRLARAS